MTVRARRRKKPRTTDSTHGFPRHPNLVKGTVPTRPNEVWVADITYLALRDCFCFLTLITDAYSRLIVGHNLSLRMTAAESMAALRMALEGLPEEGAAGLVHHSDQGSQFASLDYTGMLAAWGIKVSMTEDGDPKENAIAERVNGILKHELGLGREFATVEEAREAVREAVRLYAHERPHASIDYLTPSQAHAMSGPIPRRWKHWHERRGRGEGPA